MFWDPKLPDFQAPDFKISRNLAWARLAGLGPGLGLQWTWPLGWAVGRGPLGWAGGGPSSGPGTPRVGPLMGRRQKAKPVGWHMFYIGQDNKGAEHSTTAVQILEVETSKDTLGSSIVPKRRIFERYTCS